MEPFNIVIKITALIYVLIISLGIGKSSRLDSAYGLSIGYKANLPAGWSIKPIYSYSYWNGSDSVSEPGAAYDEAPDPAGNEQDISIPFNQYAHFKDYTQHILGAQIRDNNFYIGLNYIEQTHNLDPNNYRSSAGSNWGTGSSATSGNIACESGNSHYNDQRTSRAYSCMTERSFKGYSLMFMYKIHGFEKITLKLRQTDIKQEVESPRPIDTKSVAGRWPAGPSPVFEENWNQATFLEIEYRPVRNLYTFLGYRHESWYQGKESGEEYNEFLAGSYDDLGSSGTDQDDYVIVKNKNIQDSWIIGLRYIY